MVGTGAAATAAAAETAFGFSTTGAGAEEVCLGEAGAVTTATGEDDALGDDGALPFGDAGACFGEAGASLGEPGADFGEDVRVATAS